MNDAARLPRAFFDHPVLEVAQALLGCELAVGGATVRITETEAYAGGRDPASTVLARQTAHNAPVFGAAGHLFVYLTYGQHWMACIVTGPVGQPDVVLLRAGEVVGGHSVVQARRGGARERDWCRGPGRLTQALALKGEQSGLDLCGPVDGHGAGDSDGVGGAWVGRAQHRVSVDAVSTGARVGVRGPGGDGAAFPWRFWLSDDPSVSPYRPAARRSRWRPGAPVGQSVAGTTFQGQQPGPDERTPTP